MKIERLLSIVMHLLSRDLVSASDLARRFGVTVRTIQRDVETINAAGIPITAIHGPSGGYRILDTFRIDRQFLTFDDIFFITTALKGIGDSLGYGEHAEPPPAPGAGDGRAGSAAEPGIAGSRAPAASRPPGAAGPDSTRDKIRSLVARSSGGELAKRAERLYVDFSALGYSAGRSELVALIQSAIDRGRCLEFEYVDARLAATRRRVEPHALVFKWFSWYLFAWCRLRGEFRLFRLSRIRRPAATYELFKRRPCDLERFLEAWWNRGPVGAAVTLRFRPELRVLAEDYFAFAELEVDGEGRVLARFTLPEDRWLHGLILSYGDGVEVLEPEGLRNALAGLCERTLSQYRPGS